MALSTATKKFLDKANPKKALDKKYYGETQYKKIQRRDVIRKRLAPQIFRKPRVSIVQQQNMFAKGPIATPLESSMDLLFGGEGERLIGNTQAIFPQLNSSDVGSVVSDVQAELGIFQQPQQQMPMQMRRRRRR